MIETRDLAVPINWTQLKEQAAVLLKSGFLPTSIKTPEQAIAIILAGREIGIGMMEALRGINVIQGKPTVSPQTMLALANRTGQLEDIRIQTGDVGATVRIKRKGREWHTESFGPNEARGLGLSGKDNYTKQAPTMYKWRALAAALRVTFPDAISGLYTPEELGAEVIVDKEGEMTIVDTKTGEVAPLPFLRSDRDDSLPPQESPPKNASQGAKTPILEQEPQEGFNWMFQDCLNLALAMNEGAQAVAEEYILKLTEFPATDPKTKKPYPSGHKDHGKMVRATLEQLKVKPKWLEKVHQKVKAEYERWMRNEVAQDLLQDQMAEEIKGE